MANHFADDRAPLELTKVPTAQKVLVCPNCNTARYVSVACQGVICCGCNKFFSASQAIQPNGETKFINQNIPVDKEFTRIKGQMEEKAYAWRDEQIRTGKDKISHEPDRQPRSW